MTSSQIGSLLLLILCFLFEVQAEKLPDNHFLAPRDLEPMTLNGIERLGGNNYWKAKLKKCADGIDHMACSLKEGIKNSSQSKDFFKNHTFADVTFFGESHIKPSIQSSFAKLIENISDKKVRAIGLEMFNETSQAEINQYLLGMMTLDEIVKVLESQWNYQSAGYREILKVAKEKNLHIIALDNRPQFRYEELGVGLLGRDRIMAKNLINYKQDFPDDKVIVYSGKLHAFRSLSMDGSILTISEMLEQAYDGISRESYLFYTKKSSSPPSVVRKILQPDMQEDIMIKVPSYGHYVDGLILIN